MFQPAATVSQLTKLVAEALSEIDLRSSFQVFEVFVGRPDGDGGEGEGGEEEEEDDDTGDEEGGDDASGDGAQSGIKDPEKKRLSDEAAKHRNNTKAVQKQLDEALLKLRAQEDKDKSELEKAQRDLKEAQDEIKVLRSDQAKDRLQLSFFRCGASGQLQDPSDALRFLDLSELDTDDDGNVDDKAMLAAVEDLLKKKPYLARNDDSGSGEGSGQASGKQTNGKKTKGEADQAALAKKFPALQGRG